MGRVRVCGALFHAGDSIVHIRTQSSSQQCFAYSPSGAIDERTRHRAVITLGFMSRTNREPIVESTPLIVSALVPLLDDSSDLVLAEPIATLRSFGPAARVAVAPLRERMLDDDDFCASSAALAIGEIDPTVDIGPRLIELVEAKHSNWYSAAFFMSGYVEAERVRQVLTKIYDKTESASERKMVIQALNQIQPDSEPRSHSTGNGLTCSN